MEFFSVSSPSSDVSRAGNRFNAGLLSSPRQNTQEIGRSWLPEKDLLLVLSWHIQDCRFNAGHFPDTTGGTEGKHKGWSRKIQCN